MSMAQSARRDRWRALSLEWKLPLVMTGGIGAALAVLLLSTYFVLRRRAESTARERMTHGVRQVALEVTQALSDRAKQFHAVADDPAVRRALLAARDARVMPSDGDAARRVLQQLIPATDSTRPVLLLNANGAEVLHAGHELPASELPSVAALTGAPDSAGDVRFTSLEPQDGRARFWVIARVVEAGVRIGFIVQPRYITGQREALSRLRELLLDDVSLYMRNADGSTWVAAPGEPVAPPTEGRRTETGLTAVRQGIGRVFAEEAPVQNAPWFAVLESPVAAVMTPRVTKTLSLLVPLSGLVVLVGALVSLVIGRRITRPLRELTAAAESVPLGTYDHPVTGGLDELGRLAASFDSMARQVAAARRELEQRAAEADAARREAEAANSAKSDFLAMMSHELRTPLNAIGGYAQLMQMGVHGPTTLAQQDALRRIERSQAHLLALITDLLDFARIDAGRVQFAIEDVPLDEVLASVAALAGPQLQSRALRFTQTPAPIGVFVRADRARLSQVLLNLAGNAIKYTRDGGEIALTADADERSVRIYVRDTGPGIAADRLEEIFEPFVQGDRAFNRPNDGVGLGLAISRQLARGMDGDVTLASVVGRGSTFTVTVPRAAHVAPPQSPFGETGVAATTA